MEERYSRKRIYVSNDEMVQIKNTKNFPEEQAAVASSLNAHFVSDLETSNANAWGKRLSEKPFYTPATRGYHGTIARKRN